MWRWWYDQKRRRMDSFFGTQFFFFFSLSVLSLDTIHKSMFGSWWNFIKINYSLHKCLAKNCALLTAFFLLLHCFTFSHYFFFSRSFRPFPFSLKWNFLLVASSTFFYLSLLRFCWKWNARALTQLTPIKPKLKSKIP